MGSLVSCYRKITDDVFELQRELPATAHADAIVHLLRSRGTNLLMIVGSAATYQLLPRIRAAMPQLRIVDHLYNTIGHLANNRRFAAHIDFHIVANEEVREALLASGERDERIRVIPHGIDMDHHSPDKVSWQRGGCERLPLREGEKLVLYAGRFSEEKGVLRFVDIVDSMRNRNQIVFAMLGDGPLRPDVERKIEQLGLHDRVRLLGFVDDSRPYLRRADAVVIPSDIEGLPLVCLEALALGTPVVASAIGALPSVVRPGVTGALANPKGIESFVDGIDLALRLDADRERLAATCRETVVRSFAIEKVREAYFDVFHGLAGSFEASPAAAKIA
jgi:glycosyltransferase involved in cell wall biosynthesis